MARNTGTWGWLGGLVLLFVAGMGLLLWSSASDSAPPAVTRAVDFDGDRAMKDLETVCKIGPRISGSDGMKDQQKLIEKHFTDLGAKVTYQKFTGKQPRKKPVECANLIVSYNPEMARRVILCSHYDTRPIADQENNPKRWTDPFVSANDGASGVALLMELGRHMKGLKLQCGVDFVFFDAEEYIHDSNEDVDNYFLGSRHFAREAARNRRSVQYTGAILLDMIAGKGAEFPIEQNSYTHASKLVKEVWDIAAELKCDAFTRGFSKVAVNDDHIPLNEGGIPAIDIIDFEYPHWHKLSDVPKNCGPKALTQVGRVCSLWIQRRK